MYRIVNSVVVVSILLYTVDDRRSLALAIATFFFVLACCFICSFVLLRVLCVNGTFDNFVCVDAPLFRSTARSPFHVCSFKMFPPIFSLVTA